MMYFEDALYHMRKGYGIYRKSRRNYLGARYYVMRSRKGKETFYSISFENSADERIVNTFPMTMILADDYRAINLKEKKK